MTLFWLLRTKNQWEIKEYRKEILNLIFYLYYKSQSLKRMLETINSGNSSINHEANMSVWSLIKGSPLPSNIWHSCIIWWLQVVGYDFSPTGSTISLITTNYRQSTKSKTLFQVTTISELGKSRYILIHASLSK